MVNGTDNISGGLLPVEETCSHYGSDAFHIKCLVGMYGVCRLFMYYDYTDGVVIGERANSM